MKKIMLLALAALLGANIAMAAVTANDLTPKAVKTAMEALTKKERVAYAREVIEAIAAKPQDETTKTQELISASRALISGARSGGALAVIAEIYNSTPIENLQGVSEMLSRTNFDQKVNRMTDEQYDSFITQLVESASKYIEISGTDSPTLRVSILVAAFSKASSDPERSREKLLAALPASMQAAAATFVAASENGKTDVIAAAAGVDEVVDTPKDPDADKVVTPAPEAKSDYLESSEPSVPRTEDDGEEDAKVPLLSRLQSDVQGMVFDAMTMALYDWDVDDPETRMEDPALSALLGIGSVTSVPDDPTADFPTLDEFEAPSPSYGNQETVL